VPLVQVWIRWAEISWAWKLISFFQLILKIQYISHHKFKIMKSSLRNLIHEVLSNNIKSMTQFLVLKKLFWFWKKIFDKIIQYSNNLCSTFYLNIRKSPQCTLLLIKGFWTIPSAWHRAPWFERSQYHKQKTNKQSTFFLKR